MNDDLQASRARFEESLGQLRDDTHRELGWMPRTGRWIVPLLAAALGVALGIGVRRALPRRRRFLR